MEYVMAGTREGGIKASQTNRTRHGKDFYKRIGRMGGMKGNTGGFAKNPALARIAGKKGGSISKRGTVYDALKRIKKAIIDENVSIRELAYLQAHTKEIKEMGLYFNTFITSWGRFYWL